MARDDLLASTDVEDAISQAYIAAIAARAGYVVSKKDFDRDGVDLTIEAGGHMRPKIDIQLKATINLLEIGEAKDRFSFHCPKRNCDLLRIASQTPRMLVVLRLPQDQDQWLTTNPDELIIRHCAYWISILNAPELEEGKQGKSVHLPKTNRLDSHGLSVLMERSRSGRLL